MIDEDIKVFFCCLEHNERLNLEEGKYGYYYLCPKYFYENHGDEPACVNRISKDAASEIADSIRLSHVTGKLVEGTTYEILRYIYKVVSIRGNKVCVGIKTKEGGKRINASKTKRV